MKCLAIFLLCFISLQANGQTNFQNQFRLLVQDAEMGLLKHRGDFKEVSASDSVFYSTITLEGTTNNSISVTGNTFFYIAEGEDSLNEKQGKKLTHEFKSKIVAGLNPKYVISQLKVERWNLGIYGWRFKHEGITISLTLYKKSTSKSYFILLGIDNSEVIN